MMANAAPDLVFVTTDDGKFKDVFQLSGVVFSTSVCWFIAVFLLGLRLLHDAFIEGWRGASKQKRSTSCRRPCSSAFCWVSNSARCLIAFKKTMNFENASQMLILHYLFKFN